MPCLSRVVTRQRHKSFVRIPSKAGAACRLSAPLPARAFRTVWPVLGKITFFTRPGARLRTRCERLPDWPAADEGMEIVFVGHRRQMDHSLHTLEAGTASKSMQLPWMNSSARSQAARAGARSNKRNAKCSAQQRRSIHAPHASARSVIQKPHLGIQCRQSMADSCAFSPRGICLPPREGRAG